MLRRSPLLVALVLLDCTGGDPPPGESAVANAGAAAPGGDAKVQSDADAGAGGNANANAGGNASAGGSGSASGNANVNAGGSAGGSAAAAAGVAGVDAPRSDAAAIRDVATLVKVATLPQREENAMISLLHSTDGHAFAAVGPLVYVLQPDGALEHERTWVRGIEPDSATLESAEIGMFWWNANTIGGTWPDGAYLVLQSATGSRGGDEAAVLYRRSNARWTRIDTKVGKLDWYPTAFGPWKEGSLLALKAFTTRYSTDGEGDVEPPAKEVRAYEAAVARQKKLVVLRGRPKAPDFGAHELRAFASLASGEIFGIVEEQGKAAVLHHDEAAGTAKVLPLPEAEKLNAFYLRIRATAADRVWTYGTTAEESASHGYLARFDGAAWHRVATPCDSIDALSIDAEGAVWLACPIVAKDGGITRVLLRQRGETVEQLPIASLPREVIARGPGDVWVLADGDLVSELWHTGAPAGEPLALPGALEGVRAVLEWADPQPLAACDRPWIPLVAGSDREAIGAKLETLHRDGIYAEVIEARVQGKVELGVSIPSPGSKNTARTVKRIVKQLGDAAGTPSCNERPAVAGDEQP